MMGDFFLALHCAGGAHWRAFPGCQLLPLARHGAHTRLRALSGFYAVFAGNFDGVFPCLVDTPQSRGESGRGAQDGWCAPSLIGGFRRHVGEEHVVNIMILTTFLSFLLYRRGNKGARVPMAQQSTASKVTLVMIAVVAILLMWNLDQPLADPAQTYHRLPLWILETLVIIAAVGLAFADRGTVGQWLLFAMSAGRRRLRGLWLLRGSDRAYRLFHPASSIGVAGAARRRRLILSFSAALLSLARSAGAKFPNGPSMCCSYWRRRSPG